MRTYFAEFIATFILVFCGTGAIIISQESGGSISHAGIAITFGLIVTAMIYALGGISGAHMNPAVTIALWVAKEFKFKHILPYVIAQSLGGLMASALLRFMFPSNQLLGATIPAGSEMQSFLLEVILTFILMLVILSFVKSNKESKNLAGLVIGLVVLLEAMFAGPICGASMNPVRSIAPAIVSTHTEHLWIYLIAPLAGALFAVVSWAALQTNQHSNPKHEN
ncbi:MAG: MIP family channel protein [Bacteroidia bacterium]|nr:MIP family channel protein [Bacteroidia bacterium]